MAVAVSNARRYEDMLQKYEKEVKAVSGCREKTCV